MTTRKAPPPPPDADLSPFEVGAYLAGHVPEYAVHLLQVGGTTQAERIERHRRYLTPEGFAEWLETEDAKRTDVDPVRLVEYSGFGGSMTSAQSVESFAEIEKSPEIQAAHLEAVKVNRKAKAERALEKAGSKRGGDARSAPMADRLQVAANDWWRRNPNMSIREVSKRLANGEKANGGSVARGVFGGVETIRKAIKKPHLG